MAKKKTAPTKTFDQTLCEKAVDFARESFEQTKGAEKEAVELFYQEFSNLASEWQMRLDELNAEEEGE